MPVTLKEHDAMDGLNPSVLNVPQIAQRGPAIYSAELVNRLQHRIELLQQRKELAINGLIAIAAAPSYRSEDWLRSKAADALADLADLDARIERGEA